jgi:hypothetical protein
MPGLEAPGINDHANKRPRGNVKETREGERAQSSPTPSPSLASFTYVSTLAALRRVSLRIPRKFSGTEKRCTMLWRKLQVPNYGDSLNYDDNLN